jgi:endonuclease/exonuclease/phosphatase (EEP) superfamily protein YafD
MGARVKRTACTVGIVICWIYLGLLFLWLGFNIFANEQFTLIALINYLAVYLFLPLFILLIIAIACRNWYLGIGFLVGLLVFLLLWGAQFTPRISRISTGQPTLTVMTYNVLAWHNYIDPILDTIKFENPDILLLQELNTNLANALQVELSDIYPYQVLQAVDNPTGIGVISKYPLRPTGEELPARWIGGPQVLEVEWNDQLITLVNFHMTPTTGVFPLDRAALSIRLRQQEAHLLADLACRSDSVIMAGDANTTTLSKAYQVITSELYDGYRVAGFGLGHTFPGSDIPGSDRPHIGKWYVPPWLARIDYVFYSDDWAAVSANTASFDGVSDHRGVVVELIRNK